MYCLYVFCGFRVVFFNQILIKNWLDYIVLNIKFRIILDLNLRLILSVCLIDLF